MACDSRVERRAMPTDGIDSGARTATRGSGASDTSKPPGRPASRDASVSATSASRGTCTASSRDSCTRRDNATAAAARCCMAARSPIADRASWRATARPSGIDDVASAACSPAASATTDAPASSSSPVAAATRRATTNVRCAPPLASRAPARRSSCCENCAWRAYSASPNDARAPSRVCADNAAVVCRRYSDAPKLASSLIASTPDAPVRPFRTPPPRSPRAVRGPSISPGKPDGTPSAARRQLCARRSRN